MYDKQMCRLLLSVRQAIGVGVILLGALPAFAEDGRVSAQVEAGPVLLLGNNGSTAVFAEH